MKVRIINNPLFFSIVALMIFPAFFISCDDDGDTTPPVINLIAPAEGAVLKLGSDVHFDMQVSDNEMLKSYKVEIHENMSNPHDHNSHKRSAISEEKPNYFSYRNTWTDIEGLRNKDVHHHDIIIPADVTPGNYHLIVYCTDAAGNEASVFRNIVISPDGEDQGHE